jgi:hypothetical protein
MQGIRRLIEPRLRSIAVLRELADAVIGLLRQHHAGLRALERGLARFDHLGARADIDVRELCLGDDFGRQRLLVLCNGLGVVDPHQHGAGRNILPAKDWNLADASVDPRRDVEPRCIHLTLHEQRLGSHQVPDGQAGNGDDHRADDDGWGTRGPGARVHLLLFRLHRLARLCSDRSGLVHLKSSARAYREA